MSAIDLKPFLARLAKGETLDEAEAEAAFSVMISGAASAAQIGGFLMALRVRGETIAEITGAARALRAEALQIEAPAGAIDTCGTGGDGGKTFNISTAAAIVAAAAGVPVAKHGNRNLSSRCGSADVLAALDVDIEAEMPLLRRSLREVGIAFLMAPRHNSAMRHVAESRVALGTRTIFNLLGPLANPAGAKRQLIGVFAPEWLRPMAEVLRKLGCERAWVVHGAGLDELTTTGITKVAALNDGVVTQFEVTPEDAGLPRAELSDLAGGDAAENAVLMRRLLAGETGPIRDIVLLNSAAALLVGGKVGDLRAGIAISARTIDSGAAAETLTRMAAISRSKDAA